MSAEPSAGAPTTFEVRAEMAGNVYRILVGTGDTVAKGDQLIVLESMKMEIPVIATQAGTVLRVEAAQDAVVAEDDVLVVLARPA